MTRTEKKPEDRPLMRLYALMEQISKASTESDLAATERHIDDILKIELEKHANGNTNAAESGRSRRC